MNEKDKQKKQERKVEKRARKLSEYGRQLQEKQKVKHMYGMRERQFRRFFSIASKSSEATGDMLLSLLERRLDNVLFRLKFSTTRRQARQIIVHGHVMVNGKKVYTPSYLVSIGDVLSFAPEVVDKEVFVEQVINRRLKIGIKVPDWLELDKADKKGKIIRVPVRTDIPTTIEDHLIVELYSK